MIAIVFLIIFAGICVLRRYIGIWREEGNAKSLFYIEQAKAIIIALLAIAGAILALAIYLTKMGF